MSRCVRLCQVDAIDSNIYVSLIRAIFLLNHYILRECSEKLKWYTDIDVYCINWSWCMFDTSLIQQCQMLMHVWYKIKYFPTFTEIDVGENFCDYFYTYIAYFDVLIVSSEVKCVKMCQIWCDSVCILQHMTLTIYPHIFVSYMSQLWKSIDLLNESDWKWKQNSKT